MTDRSEMFKMTRRGMLGTTAGGAVAATAGAAGLFGSAKAAKAAADVNAQALRDAYGIARRNYYFAIADRRPASRKYARTRSGGKGGWIKRAEEFISPEFHLSQEEFAQRVSAWG